MWLTRPSNSLEWELPRAAHMTEHKPFTRSKRRRLPAKMRPIIPSLLLLTCLPSVRSQLCERVDNSMDSLLRVIELSFGFAIVCPFQISGDSCPTNGIQVKTTELYLMCEQSPDEAHTSQGCVIDCPGIHFDILPYSSLTLDRFKLKNSKASSVKIRPMGSFTAYETEFVNNLNESGNGGAIVAGVNSRIHVISSIFQNNSGLSGGAIYHLGIATIQGSHFFDNKASNGGGGAVFSGSKTFTNLVGNEFAGNRAAYFGPAVFDGSGAITTSGNNSGCGNAIESGLECNGISRLQNGSNECSAFKIECIAPTATPSAVTAAPSISPTSTPSNTPTLMSSSAPSRTPSIFPTTTPSDSPTLNPSSAPSDTPSTPPSNQPTRVTLFPTRLRSASPSSAPSRGPSQSPSALPSFAPTQTDSSIPSRSPSVSPSTFPTPLESNMPSLFPTLQSSLPTTLPTILPTLTSMPPSVDATTNTNMAPSLPPSISNAANNSHRKTGKTKSAKKRLRRM